MDEVKKTKPKKEVKAVPKIRDEKSNLRKLSFRDFPYNREGRLAYCDYRILCWQARKALLMAKTDPRAKLNNKKTKLLAQLKDLEAKIEQCK